MIIRSESRTVRPFEGLGLAEDIFSRTTLSIDGKDHEAGSLLLPASQVKTGTFAIKTNTNLKELQSLHELMTLEELLNLAISARKHLLIETKHPNIHGGRIERSVVELLQSMANNIKEAGIEVVVMSFSKFAVRRVQSDWVASKVSKYYLPAIFSKSKISALDIDLITKYPSLVKKLQERNSRILIWTVNEEVDFERCKKLGIDGVITNFPEIARRYG